MAQFSVKSGNLQDIINIEGKLARDLDNLGEEIHDLSSSLGFRVAAKADISRRLRDAADSVAACWSGMNGMMSGLQNVSSRYDNSENSIIRNLNGGNAVGQDDVPGDSMSFSEKESGSPDWLGLLWKGIGTFGGGGKLIGALGKVATTDKSGIAKWADFISDINKSGWKIGDAIKLCTNEPDVSWLEAIFGLNKHGFLNSIKNSGLSWQQRALHGADYGFKHTLRELKTTKGLVKQGTGILLSLVTNGISNYEEYKNGEISANRAAVETVSETVVDWGKDFLIGVGVTTALAAAGVAAPAMAVGAATVAISVAADWVCEKVCGKKVTEAVSDLVLDTGEKIVNTVSDLIGDGAKAVKKGAEAAWNGITKGVSGFFNGLTKGFGKPAFA